MNLARSSFCFLSSPVAFGVNDAVNDVEAQYQKDN